MKPIILPSRESTPLNGIFVNSHIEDQNHLLGLHHIALKQNSRVSPQKCKCSSTGVMDKKLRENQYLERMINNIPRIINEALFFLLANLHYIIQLIT